MEPHQTYVLAREIRAQFQRYTLFLHDDTNARLRFERALMAVQFCRFLQWSGLLSVIRSAALASTDTVLQLEAQAMLLTTEHAQLLEHSQRVVTDFPHESMTIPVVFQQQQLSQYGATGFGAATRN